MRRTWGLVIILDARSPTDRAVTGLHLYFTASRALKIRKDIEPFLKTVEFVLANAIASARTTWMLHIMHLRCSRILSNPFWQPGVEAVEEGCKMIVSARIPTLRLTAMPAG